MIYRYLHICFCFVFITELSYSQYSIIPTNTNIDIDEIEKFGNTVVIMANSQFLVRCNDDCLSLESIFPVGMQPYSSTRSLVVTDTNNYYFLNFNDMQPSIYSKLYKTSDGGQNWNEQVLPNSHIATDLVVFDSSYYLAFDDDDGIYTLDSGMNWLQGATLPFITVTKSVGINDSTAFIGGFEKIAYTTNKGATWISDDYVEAGPLNFTSKSLDSLYFVSNTAVNGTLSYIFNQGLSNRIDREIPNTLPIGIYVVSRNEIYVTGKDYSTNKGRILKTTDLGLTWSYFEIQENKYLADLVPLNDSVFLIGGQGGLLIKWNKNSTMLPITLGLSETNRESGIRIFPNPSGTKQYMELNNPSFERIEVSVYDALGRNLEVFFSDYQPNTDEKITIDISNLPKGTFFYRIKLGNQIIHKPFQKL